MNGRISAEDLIKRFSMDKHIENGMFVEKNDDKNNDDKIYDKNNDDSEKNYRNISERPSSGLIYYYVGPQERTLFHVIDCDEYWCYVAGSPLEICMIDPSGNVTTRLLGITDESEPAVLIKAGTYFASAHCEKPSEGTFLSCITVPRFSYEGFKMFSDEEIIRKFPNAESYCRLHPV